MKLLLIISILTSNFIYSQDIKFTNKTIDNGFTVFVTNNEFCPVSIKINFELNNLKSIHGNNKIYVIPAQIKDFKITDLTSIRNGKYSFSYKYISVLGTFNKSNYDKDYIYKLPFTQKNSFKVTQGYNGTFSHQNKNALDFDMPIGTNILASRDGIVVKVVDSNNRGCSEEKCKAYNNYIIIYHSDGTFSDYSHIKYKGSNVKIGDKVKKGDIIAKSGNVGWSTDPHLHFEVYLQKIDKKITIKTKFKVQNDIMYLRKGFY